MNRIDRLFAEKQGNVLSVYFTAGFPALNDTLPVMEALQEGGADLIEIGIPFSDPVADGPTIQASNQTALDNGMTLVVLFEQIKAMRTHIRIPVLLMGYVNPVMQFGLEKFCQKCSESGVDGLILPDLPLAEYLESYQAVFEAHGLHNIFLITPQTTEKRIREIDRHSRGFIYMVSSASVTGAKTGISENQHAYFKRIQDMGLKNPRLIGFGISDHDTFDMACQYAHGAIIGSAFIKVLEKRNTGHAVSAFVKAVKG